MIPVKYLQPDAAVPTGGSAAPKANTTAAIPAADVDFMDVSKAVAAAWLSTPGITLIWKTSAAFNAEVQGLALTIGGRKATGSLRPGQTFTLQQLDKKMDDAVKEVKVYIERKFKTAGAATQFARYGIVKEGSMYRLSRDRNNRLEALQLMITAIAADGFGTEEYGTAFWTGM